jgi:nitroreductase
MEFIDVVKKRRSIRKFTEEVVPDQVVRTALEAAVLAPNSSNVQAWNFFWVRNLEPRKKLINYCLNQSAARTANHLVVVVGDPALWRRSQRDLVDWVEKSKAPQLVHTYYKKMIPATYTWGPFNFWGYFKSFMGFLVGLFRPITRGPHTRAQLQEVCIKSAALAAENFVLSIEDQGYATCMMEGFDECRVKNLLRLGRSARVVMVVGIGRASDRGTWGPQFRLPLEKVLKEI